MGNTLTLIQGLGPPSLQPHARGEHAKKVRDTIEETPNLSQMFHYLLEAIWYGRYGANLQYDWDYSAGYRRAVVKQHFPINGDKLIFRYSGEVGVLVGGQYGGTWIPTERGRAHIYTSNERQTLIVHQRISGRVAVEEKPDVLWDRSDLERLYARLEDEYELKERAIALRHKLDAIQETTRALTDIIDTERSVRLEAIIVILIAVEILIAFIDLFVRIPR